MKLLAAKQNLFHDGKAVWLLGKCFFLLFTVGNCSAYIAYIYMLANQQEERADDAKYEQEEGRQKLGIIYYR